MATDAPRTPRRAAGTRDLRVRSQLVGPVLRAVEQAGGDAASLARAYALGAEATTGPEVVLPLASLQSLLEAAAQAAGDPLLGLHVGEAPPRGQWGALEYAAKSAPNLREALARVARYIGLLNEHVVVTFAIDAKGEGVIAQHIPGRPLCLGRQGNEFFAASVLAQARRATARPFTPTRVFFAHAEHEHRAALAASFGTDRLTWGAERNGFAVAAADLDLPLASHDPALLALLDGLATRELGDRAPTTAGSGLLAQVRSATRAGLRDGSPTLESVARSLRMSPRSLQRRLAEAGTSFQQLVEALREELARAWLAEGHRSITELAFLLGYSELGAFVRAFRRWTGTTPAAYRAGAAARGITAGTRT